MKKRLTEMTKISGCAAKIGPGILAYDDLLQFLIDNNLIKIDNNYISLKEFHVIYTEEQNIINDSIVARCWCIC